MSWHMVGLDDVLPTRWRNGAGVTRELARWPDSEDWVWRLSVAEVASDGPFSRLEGVQRWFAVLAGAGVRLHIGARTHELTRNSAPLCFDGASRVDCQLLDGATQDFNLMLRSPQGRARMKRVSGADAFVLAVPTMVALYSVDNDCTIDSGGSCVALPARSLAWRVLDCGASVQVEANDALWMEIEP